MRAGDGKQGIKLQWPYSHRFDDRELLDELDSGDYDATTPLLRPPPVEPLTFSVVELPHPHLAP